MLLTLCGCSKTPKSDINVVLIPKLTNNAFFDSANDGAQEYASEHGFTVTYSGSDVASVEMQIALIDKAISDQADAICISSVDATALDAKLDEARKSGIAVVTWDSDVTGSSRSVMVSQGTPHQLGNLLVELAQTSLASRGAAPASETIYYAWHYSQENVSDQNSWHDAGEEYIKANYPNWVNVYPENYYSNQDYDTAVSVGETILRDNPDIDLIICCDSTALPGQAQAMRNLGLTADDVSITGFCSPNPMKEYCEEGIITTWALWDCKLQAAMGCYLAYYVASGNSISVGDKVNIPGIGFFEIMPNTVLDKNAYSAKDSGTVLLASRLRFTIDNMNDYDY